MNILPDLLRLVTAPDSASVLVGFVVDDLVRGMSVPGAVVVIVIGLVLA